MPASMISAPTGSKLKVIGRSMVMVAIGPIPGSTPISVPTMHPTNARPRFGSVSAVENPSARLENRSLIAGGSEDQDARDDQDGDGQVQQVAEEPDRERRDRQSEQQDLARLRLGRGRAADHGDHRAGHGQADGADAERESDHGNED